MKKGFTLVEIVLVLGVIGILLAITTASFSQFRSSRALTQTTDMVISVLTEARSRTLASVHGEKYSVQVLSDRLVLFVGDTYDQNNPTNEIYFYETPTQLQTVSLTGGGATIRFEKLSGNTPTGGTILLQKGDETKILTLLSSGIINH